MSETSHADAPPRSARPAGDEGAIVITGIVGRMGKQVCRVLHRTHPVIGVDRRDFLDRPRDVVHHQFDLRRKKMRDVFRGGNVRAVVHLGIMHDPRASTRDHHSWNVVGFGKMLEYMAQYGVEKLVVLSSANIYGPRPDNPQFITEEAPLLGSQDFSEIRDLIEIDMLAQSFFWRNSACETVILRPTHILGRVHNAPSNYLRLPVTPTLMGFDPMIQVVHQQDVCQAIERALAPSVRGIFNVAGPDPVPLSHLLAALGRPRLPVPHTIARRLLAELFRARLSSFPAPELDHIRYVCMVDDRRAREVLGYEPQHDLRRTALAVEDR